MHFTAGVGDVAACCPGHDDVVVSEQVDREGPPRGRTLRRGCVAPNPAAGVGSNLYVSTHKIRE